MRSGRWATSKNCLCQHTAALILIQPVRCISVTGQLQCCEWHGHLCMMLRAMTCVSSRLANQLSGTVAAHPLFGQHNTTAAFRHCHVRAHCQACSLLTVLSGLALLPITCSCMPYDIAPVATSLVSNALRLDISTFEMAFLPDAPFLCTGSHSAPQSAVVSNHGCQLSLHSSFVGSYYSFIL